MSTPRKPYPSDLTDQQWDLIELFIPREKKGGRPRAVDMREVVNAILYVTRSGCQWEMLPHDFPPKSTVYEYFSAWRDNGKWDVLLKLLRGTLRQAEAPSESIHPTAASVDSQTVKASEHSEVRGYDGGKKITGIKRHIAVDTLGLLLAVSVTAASVDDAVAAPAVFQQLKPTEQPKLEKIWADGKYHNHDLNAWLDRQRSIEWDLEIVRRPAGLKGFSVLPKRWIVERTFGWLGRWRRLSRNYEHLTKSSEAMVKIASIGRMVRRLEPSTNQPEFHYRVTS